MDKIATVRVLGMPAEVGRWLLIIMGMVVLLCLGTVYSWSIFRTPLQNEMAISATASLLPYTVGLFFYAFLMPIAGFLIPLIGPRWMTTIGGIIVGLGYILSSFVHKIELLVLTYGVIAGTGVGVTYGVPMVVVSRWFPDRKGLAVGLTIVGFGLSPVITAPLASWLITTYSVRSALLLLGIAFMVVILVLAQGMKLPPQDWYPGQKQGGEPERLPVANGKSLWRNRAFYGLWLCYAIGSLVGLSAIGISSSVGEEVIAISPPVAAASVSLFALFNGVSRPLFGWLSDRFAAKYVAIFSYVLILIACLMMINSKTGQVLTYLIAFSLFWFCLGGWLAMAPTLTLRFFNPDRYAQNYGIVFTAYGAGALLGTLGTGRIRDMLGSYNYVFYPMAVLAVVGIFVALGLLKPSSS